MQDAFRLLIRFAGLSVVALSLLLTGCAVRAAGGEQTQLGMEALEKDDFNSALNYFQAAEAAREDPVVLYRAKGIALMGLGRYQESAEAFQTALDNADERMPKTVRDIRLYLATVRYRLKDYEQVIEDCRDLLSQERRADLLYLLGASLLASGDTEGARENFDEAAALTPGDYGMYLRIYECYESHNLTAVGDEYLQTALGFVADSDEDLYEAGRIYYYLEQYNEARDMLLSPAERGYVPAMRLLGEVYLKTEDYPHAQAMYRSVLDREGESPAAYNGLALCAICSGDYDEALRLIAEGLALDQEEGKQLLRFNEIVAYEKKLDFKSALVKAEAYCELYPSDEKGRKELIFLRTR